MQSWFCTLGENFGFVGILIVPKWLFVNFCYPRTFVSRDESFRNSVRFSIGILQIFQNLLNLRWLGMTHNDFVFSRIDL